MSWHLIIAVTPNDAPASTYEKNVKSMVSVVFESCLHRHLILITMQASIVCMVNPWVWQGNVYTSTHTQSYRYHTCVLDSKAM